MIDFNKEGMKMNLEKLIELLEESCNVYYDAEEVGTIENLLYGYYVDSEMFTQEELDLITDINGWNVETFNDVLYERFGYRDLEQMLEE